MDEVKNLNIAISGWSGSGSTTLALIMAKLLNRRYLHIGQVYRQLGTKLGFSNEGSSRPEFDDYIENIIGKTIDSYTDYKLLNSSNLILESDISAFRIGKHPKVFSIFLRTDKGERIKRVVAQGRQDAEIILEQRDELLKNKYHELWDINYFDEELIEKKFNLKFDNSNLAIETEIRLIFDKLKTYSYFSSLSNEYWEEIYGKIDTEVEKYWSKGKDFLLDELTEKDLYMTPTIIMQDIAKTFPEDVTHYPENIKNIFLGIN